MIIKEQYITNTSDIPLVRAYSDKGYFIQKDGLMYKDVIVVDEAAADEFTETTIPVPAAIANPEFLYKTFIGEYKDITEQQVIEAHDIVKRALRSLSDGDAYRIMFLLDEWDENTNYDIGDRVIYNNIIYRVIAAPTGTLPPNVDKECYIKTDKPFDLIEEWNVLARIVYNIGDKVKVGGYVYSSLIDNNTWSPVDFPAAWQLEGSQD